MYSKQWCSVHLKYRIRFWVLSAVNISISGFCLMTPCSLVDHGECIGLSHSFHLQCRLRINSLQKIKTHCTKFKNNLFILKKIHKEIWNLFQPTDVSINSTSFSCATLGFNSKFVAKQSNKYSYHSGDYKNTHFITAGTNDDDSEMWYR